MKAVFIFLSIAFLSTTSLAQDSETTVFGQIVDKGSHTPISFVHIIGTNDQVVSDHLGRFSIHAQVGDTLIFSHLNFERSAIQVVTLSGTAQNVYLNAKENMMQEVIIRDYLPEDEFKQEIIEHEVKTTQEEINATINVARSTLLYRSGYVPEMNSLDNFKNYLKEPQGITLFSSGPNKGLIKSIKKLTRQENSYSLRGLKLNQVKSDTVATDLFLLKIK